MNDEFAEKMRKRYALVVEGVGKGLHDLRSQLRTPIHFILQDDIAEGFEKGSDKRRALADLHSELESIQKLLEQAMNRLLEGHPAELMGQIFPEETEDSCNFVLLDTPPDGKGPKI